MGDERKPEPRPGEQKPGERPIDRRTLLKSGLLATGALAGGGVALGELVSRVLPAGSSSPPARHPHRHAGAPQVGANRGGSEKAALRAPGPYTGAAPNILVIMVDQLRTPRWFSAGRHAEALMPNLARLRKGAASFESHYTASNDCSPARAALLTGLYTHQTGCMITGGSTLFHGFPTWGTLLREQGYQTAYYGKWHLTHGDNHWSAFLDDGALEPYGFFGGTYPSPDGGPGQGWEVDPQIASQFERWIAKASSRQPWCTTVSFVNPHDIAWWYRWSDRFAPESSASPSTRGLPPNFETPEELAMREKPQLQLSFIETTGHSFGHVPYEGLQAQEAWTPFFDLYLKLLHRVDHQVGRVLRALHSRPEIAANTVVVFTSDHGEYGGSHGMRGKGASAYEEAIRVPLIVRDLRDKKLVDAPHRARRSLTSSVDVVPMLLDIATDSGAWRKDSRYAHLAHRHRLIDMVASPDAPGRPYILHATDEIVTEFAVQTYSAGAPLHITSLRTQRGKLALYSHWRPGTVGGLAGSQERELYDYRTAGGRLEIENRAGRGEALEGHLHGLLRRAIAEELHAPLPRHLHRAQRHGFADYLDTAARAAVHATVRRRRMLRRELEGRQVGGGLARMLRLQRAGQGG